MYDFVRGGQIGRVLGVESYILTPAETKKLYPLLNVDDLYGALYSPGDGCVDPTSYCAALTKAATRNGATIKEHCPVLGSTCDFFSITTFNVHIYIYIYFTYAYYSQLGSVSW